MPKRSWYLDESNTMHEQYTAQIWVGPQHLGQVTYDSGREDLHWHREGYSFFCPYCGDVWAWFIAADSSGEVLQFTVVEKGCELHREGDGMAGSILTDRLIHLLGDMPEKVVRREFMIHLEGANA